MMKEVVIIGNGISGVTAAIQIRQRSSCGITIISDEHPVFFSRTALMYVFMGHMKLEHTQPYESWFWKENNITLIQDEVTTIRTEAHEITLRSGQIKSYDTLILATGSVPRRLDCPGEELDGVHVLYHVHDLKALEQRMTQGVKRAVVAGGGLIGIELAEMLRSRRVEVDFLVRESWYWKSVLPEPEARMLEAHITSHGVRLHFNKSIQAIHGDEKGRVAFVETEHAERHMCDIACVAIGVEPNVLVGSESGVAMRKGFLVDEYLRTSAPDVYAIGDCAELRHPQMNRRAIEPVWYTGRQMGEAVAKVICGEEEKYNPGIWFNSAKFFDLEYQVYGSVNNDGSDSLYWQDPKDKRCLRLQLSEDNTLIGVHAIGMRLRQEVCERWIISGAAVQEVVRTLDQARFDAEFTSNPFPAIMNEFKQTLMISA
jgi:NAD(P)H-nitrite reductase large subunit